MPPVLPNIRPVSFSLDSPGAGRRYWWIGRPTASGSSRGPPGDPHGSVAANVVRHRSGPAPPQCLVIEVQPFLGRGTIGHQAGAAVALDKGLAIPIRNRLCLPHAQGISVGHRQAGSALLVWRGRCGHRTGDRCTQWQQHGQRKACDCRPAAVDGRRASLRDESIGPVGS